MDSFTDEELVKLYQELIKGNRSAEDGMYPEQIMTYLMEKYKPMVRKLSNTVYIIGGDNDDLAQEGMIGIYKAVNSYCDDRGAGFATHAYRCISSQLSDAQKADGREKHMLLNNALSLTAEVGENGLPLEETLVDLTEDSLEERILEQEFWKVLLENLDQKLSAMEKDVLSLFLAGEKYTDIARRLGQSPKTIDNAIQRIRKKCMEIKMEE